MSSELVRTTPDLEMMWKLSQRIAQTPFVPTGLRGKNESVLACILTGHELGIGAMQALNGIHVIDGRPAISPELMRALVFQAGHVINVVENTDSKCVLEGVRSDSGAKATVTWTMADAQKAKLADKQNWKTYPRAMLLARATSELCRVLFPDIIAGMSYTPEEIGSISGSPAAEAQVREIIEAELVEEVVTAPQAEVDPPKVEVGARAKKETKHDPAPVEDVVQNILDTFDGSEIIDAELVPGFDERMKITATWGGWPLIKGIAAMAARGMAMDPPLKAVELCNKEKLWVEVNKIMEQRRG